MRNLVAVAVVSLGISSLVSAAFAQDREARRQELLRQLEQIQAELKALEAAPPGAAPPPSPPPTTAQEEKVPTLPPVQVVGSTIVAPTPDQASTTLEREDFKWSRGFSVNELTELSPGILAKQSNGPRDLGISIRGSNAKVGFGIRNIKVFEDGFPVTQSDGLSRSDIVDPHAYEGLDIIRGPSSARYDNYALDGVLNFRQRRGRDINGFEVGTDVGSFGYHNHYATLGGVRGAFEYSLFASYVAGDGFLRHSDFHASTEDVLFSYAIDPTSSLTFKFINNFTVTHVPSRLSLNQFNADPRSAGTVTTPRPGLASITVSAEQADQKRDDQRTIVGARYEQKIFTDTTAAVTGTFDLKDIHQTFGTIGDNQNPNFNGMLDVTNTMSLWELPAKHYGGLFANYMSQDATTFFNLADGRGTRGSLQSGTRGHITNVGGRVREELTVAPGWTLVAGLGGEYSEVIAQLRTRVAPDRYNLIQVNRTFGNVAPEAALVWAPTRDLTAHVRVGTGYGIPGFGNLTTTASGLPGNNTSLKAQTDVGVEVGLDARNLFGMLDVSVTPYFEWWQNEFNTVSPAAGLQSFTTNAPASEHRGIEVYGLLRPLAHVPGGEGVYLRAAYTFQDQYYTEFKELIGGVRVDRAGKRIPGVERSFLNGRLGYESPWHIGGFAEVNYVDEYFVNNSNTLKAPSYYVLNANVHYGRRWEGSFLQGFEVFFEGRNLLDTTYIESAIPVADDLVPTRAGNNNKQAFFTGAPRSFYGGVRFRF